MAIYSPLRSRRLAAQQAEAIQRLITFQLSEETFALPLDLVDKVTTLDRLYGDPHRTGVSLTTYQGRELVVIDVGQRIFGQASQSVPASRKIEAADHPAPVKYLLILKSEREQLLGLPIDSTPSIQSIRLSAFQSLPEIYRQHGNIHCVSSFSIETPDQPSIFLLDVAAIVASN